MKPLNLLAWLALLLVLAYPAHSDTNVQWTASLQPSEAVLWIMPNAAARDQNLAWLRSQGYDFSEKDCIELIVPAPFAYETSL